MIKFDIMLTGVDRWTKADRLCMKLKLVRNEAHLYITLYCLDRRKYYSKQLIQNETCIRSKTTFYRAWKNLEAKGLLIELHDRFVLFKELGAAFRVNDEK